MAKRALFSAIDITDDDVEFNEISTTKKPRVLFTSLYAIQRYYTRWVVNPYHCTDSEKWQGWYPEQNVLEHNGRRYKIFKKCAPWCIQKCSNVVGRTIHNYKIFDNWAYHVPKSERSRHILLWDKAGDESTNRVY